MARESFGGKFVNVRASDLNNKTNFRTSQATIWSTEKVDKLIKDAGL